MAVSLEADVVRYKGQDKNKTVFLVVENCDMKLPCGMGRMVRNYSIGGRWGTERHNCILSGEQALCGKHVSNVDVMSLNKLE